MNEVLARHQKIGFQFSGGRDSLAALYALRDYWSDITVYHLDAGERFPETVAVVDRVSREVPNFVYIKGDLEKTERERGYPTDLLPARSNTILGKMHYGSKLSLIDRYECCYWSVMKPMHDRMIKDGVTLIIRGQRDSDYATPPLRSGSVENGIECYYPIQGWSDDQVLEYLNSIGVEPTPFYAEGLDTTPECMTCSGWWEDGRAKYLAKHHPEAHHKYIHKITLIKKEIDSHLNDLCKELTT